jgi:hypothetical protein
MLDRGTYVVAHRCSIMGFCDARKVLIMGIWQGVSKDFLKYH